MNRAEIAQGERLKMLDGQERTKPDRRKPAFTSEDAQRAHEQMTETAREQGVYRRRFRA